MEHNRCLQTEHNEYVCMCTNIENKNTTHNTLHAIYYSDYSQGIVVILTTVIHKLHMLRYSFNLLASNATFL